MIPYLPKQISNRAIITYLIALIAISVFYSDYAMRFGYMALGLLFVISFFSLSSLWSKDCCRDSERDYIKSLFIVAVVVRLVWVIASYFYYQNATGIPFEFDTADALSYHEEAKWLAGEKWSKTSDFRSKYS